MLHSVRYLISRLIGVVQQKPSARLLFNQGTRHKSLPQHRAHCHSAQLIGSATGTWSDCRRLTLKFSVYVSHHTDWACIALQEAATKAWC